MRKPFNSNQLKNKVYVFLAKSCRSSFNYLDATDFSIYPMAVFTNFGNNLHKSEFETRLMSWQKDTKHPIILSTMNPDVVDMLYFANWNDVQDVFVFVSDDGNTVEHMSEEEARRFYLSYNVGLQHVREILWQQGLW